MGDYCHKNQIKFVIANTKGLFGYIVFLYHIKYIEYFRQIFCDFGDNFQVSDIDGEKPQTHIVTNISHVCFANLTFHRIKSCVHILFIGREGNRLPLV